MTASVTAIIGLADWLPNTINYEIIKGNAIWRFGLVLLVVLVAMAAGRIIQFAINSYAKRLAKKRGQSPLTLLLKALANPIYVAIFAAGIFADLAVARAVRNRGLPVSSPPPIRAAYKLKQHYWRKIHG